MTVIAGIVVVAFAAFLLGLAAFMVLRPAPAARFLRCFASSALTHYVEQLARLVVGLALVVYSSEMWAPFAFLIFGWVLVITAAMLLCIPWRWHHRFGQWVIPLAIRHMKLHAVGALALGAFVLFAVIRGAVEASVLT